MGAVLASRVARDGEKGDSNELGDYYEVRKPECGRIRDGTGKAESVTVLMRDSASSDFRHNHFGTNAQVLQY